MKARKSGLVVLGLSLMIGISLVTLGLTYRMVSRASSYPAAKAAPGVPSNGDSIDPGVPPRVLTLNTVDYALKVVGQKVLIPDVSSLSPGYRIVGVQVLRTPQVETIGAITYTNWALDFVVTDLPFANGTTLDSTLAGHYIRVGEASDTGYWNSHDAAVEFMGPGQVCRWNDTSSTQTTCTGSPGTTPSDLIQIRSTWLAVYPSVPSTTFYIDGINRAVTIWGDLSYKQMLAVADSTIP